MSGGSLTGAGMTQASLEQTLGDATKVGMATAMKNKWISSDKATKTLSAVCDSVTDDGKASYIYKDM